MKVDYDTNLGITDLRFNCHVVGKVVVVYRQLTAFYWLFIYFYWERAAEWYTLACDDSEPGSTPGRGILELDTGYRSFGVGYEGKVTGGDAMNKPSRIQCSVLHRTCRLSTAETRDEHLPYDLKDWGEPFTFFFIPINDIIALSPVLKSYSQIDWMYREDFQESSYFSLHKTEQNYAMLPDTFYISLEAGVNKLPNMPWMTAACLCGIYTACFARDTSNHREAVVGICNIHDALVSD